MSTEDPHPILLYDGACGLCNRAVRFVLRREREDHFRFAALQSELARTVLSRHDLTSESLDTMCLVLNYAQPSESLLSRSDAGLAILQRLGRVPRMLAAVGGLLPRTVRNFFYNLIATHRYRFFGRYETCPAPTPEQRAKFLDQ